MSMLKVLVTRPAVQAASWVKHLQDAGFDAAPLPLIGIDPPEDMEAVAAAWEALPGRKLVVFVSPNAAHQFFALAPDSKAWPEGTLAASPGPGTTASLLMLGIPQAQIIEPAASAAQFDSESLWEELRRIDWLDAEVSIVRAQGGREWLADKLRASGAVVSELNAYRSGPPRLNDAEHRLLVEALLKPKGHAWLFSSSQSIENLVAEVPGFDWHEMLAVTTHPRIADTARKFGCVSVIGARPELASVIESLRQLAASGGKEPSIQSPAP
jgi:uroporphyrinogen-III synthase